MNPRSFFTELKRRNVYKVAIAYAVVAWLLMQVASQIFPFFDIPSWGVRLVVLLLIIGFPVALILAWAFELTPEGIKRAEDVNLSESVRRKTGRKLDFFIIAVLLLVIAVLIFQRLHPKVSPAVSSAPEKSIAVLPFDNLSEEKANAYFADGIQDEILTKLAGVGDLKVISRKSTAKYKSMPEDLKTVARELGVATVLEGSVQRAGDRVRVNVQLLDAHADTHLWAKSYDRDLKDVFTVESEVAQEIADALRAKLSPSQSDALHPSIIHYLNGALESGFEIESFPAASQVVRVLHDSAFHDRARIPDRNRVILPVFRSLSDSNHHLLGCQLRSRRKLLRLLLAAGQKLYTGPTDINHED
jgi:TolB-like protein